MSDFWIKLPIKDEVWMFLAEHIAYYSNFKVIYRPADYKDIPIHERWIITTYHEFCKQYITDEQKIQIEKHIETIVDETVDKFFHRKFGNPIAEEMFWEKAKMKMIEKLGSSTDEFEEFLDYRKNIKSARS